MALTEAEAQKKYPVLSALAKSTGQTLATFTSIFLVLKLTDTGVVGDWSWWAVFLPTIIRYSIVAFLLVLTFVLVLAVRDRE